MKIGIKSHSWTNSPEVRICSHASCSNGITDNAIYHVCIGNIVVHINPCSLQPKVRAKRELLTKEVIVPKF